VQDYGRKIELVKDLKGNFPKEVGTTFTVWGAGTPYISYGKQEFLNVYEKQDTLLLLLVHTEFWNKRGGDVPQNVIKEKGNDYTTLSCVKSVLKYSNGYVSGFIFPYVEGMARLPMDTISCQELQMILQMEVNLCE